MAYEKQQNQTTRKGATQNANQNFGAGQSDTEFASDTASSSQGTQGAGNVSKIPNRRG